MSAGGWGAGRWGSVRWGDGHGTTAQAAVPPTFSVSPATVERDGGYEVVIAIGGDGVSAGTYRIHVGPAGDSTDRTCYSGVFGAADEVEIPAGPVSIVVTVPPLPVGGPYRFYFEQTTGDSGAFLSFQTVPLLSVVPHLFRSGRLSIRRLFSRHMNVGARLPNRVEFPQT